jgi:hypothetical protein
MSIFFKILADHAYELSLPNPICGNILSPNAVENEWQQISLAAKIRYFKVGHYVSANTTDCCTLEGNST